MSPKPNIPNRRWAGRGLFGEKGPRGDGETQRNKNGPWQSLSCVCLSPCFPISFSRRRQEFPEANILGLFCCSPGQSLLPRLWQGVRVWSLPRQLLPPAKPRTGNGWLRGTVTHWLPDAVVAWGGGWVRGRWPCCFLRGKNPLLVTLTPLNTCSCCHLQTPQPARLLYLPVCVSMLPCLPLSLCSVLLFPPFASLLSLLFPLSFLSSRHLCLSVFLLWDTERSGLGSMDQAWMSGCHLGTTAQASARFEEFFNAQR